MKSKKSILQQRGYQRKCQVEMWAVDIDKILYKIMSDEIWSRCVKEMRNNPVTTDRLKLCIRGGIWKALGGDI